MVNVSNERLINISEHLPEWIKNNQKLYGRGPIMNLAFENSDNNIQLNIPDSYNKFLKEYIPHVKIETSKNNKELHYHNPITFLFQRRFFALFHRLIFLRRLQHVLLTSLSQAYLSIRGHQD